jgi:hypothetical protein
MHDTYIKIVLIVFTYQLIIRKHNGMSNLKKIQPTSSHSASLRPIWIFSAHLRLDLPSGLLSQISAIELFMNRYCPSYVPHSLLISFSWFDYRRNIWWGVLVMMLDPLQCLPSPRYVHPLRPTYFLLHLFSNIISLYAPLTWESAFYTNTK